MHSICWFCCLSVHEEEEDEDEDEDEDEEAVPLLVPSGTAAALARLAGAAAGGISRGGTRLMCPGRDRGATWDTGEDRESWLSPTPSELLHATIAMSTVRKLRATNFFSRREHEREGVSCARTVSAQSGQVRHRSS